MFHVKPQADSPADVRSAQRAPSRPTHLCPSLLDSSPRFSPPHSSALKARRLFRAGLALSLSLVFMFSAQHAEARRPKRKELPKVSSALQNLRWGESHHKVVEYLGKVIKKRYQAVITKTINGTKADQLRREMREAVKDLKKEYTEFSGQRTGYSVSFLKHDFVHNNGETLLRFKEDNRTRYFFFRYDQLWKVVVSYPSDLGLSFNTFVDRVRSKYGRPNDEKWETPYGGSRQLSVVTWQDDKTILQLEDQSNFHGVYVMKLISLAEGSSIEESHARKHKKAPRDLDAPKKIGGGINIFGEEENVEEVVDQITGTKHKVNLKRVQEVPAEQLKEDGPDSVVPRRPR